MQHLPGFLQPEEFAKVYALVPIPCVDLVVIHNGHFLLGLRNNEPAKGQWFLPGGRILKNETLKVAAVRKASEELGISTQPDQFELLTTADVMFEHGPFSSDSYHNINIVFALKLTTEPALTADTQHSGLKWFSEVDPTWHPYVKEALKAAGF